MSYAGPEVIDFKKYRGTIGLFGDNRSGKSVIIDAILYALFNKTTRNVKNVDLINKVNGSKTCSVELNITIRGIAYKIVRESKKQFKKRTGDYHWTRTDLSLSRVFEDGTEEDLTETQRNETEKIIRNAIGSYDDFLTTTLTIQSSQHEFIFQNPAVRSENMARFLGLDIFNRKHDVAKDIMREVDAARKVSDLTEKTTLFGSLEKDIVKYEKTEDAAKRLLSEAKDKIESTHEILTTLRTSLNTKITVSETREEIEQRQAEVNDEITTLKTGIVEHQDKIAHAENRIGGSTNESGTLHAALIPITEEELKLFAKATDLQNVEREVIAAVALDEQYIASLRKDLENEDGCPILDIFDAGIGITADEVGIKDPPCVFIERQAKKREELAQRTTNVKTLNDKLLTIKEKLARISVIDERHYTNTQTHNAIKEQGEIIERSLAETKTLLGAVEVKEMTIAMLNEKIEIINKNEEIVEKNRETQKKILELQDNINTLQSERDRVQIDLTKASSSLAVAENRLADLKIIIDDIMTNDHKYMLYSWYTKAMHRNGIPITVLKKHIPVINYELNAILSPIVGYGVYFKIDEGSDNIDIVMRYDDTKDDTRPITMASGMEKFIANMAIRHVLLKISCLNKPTIRIIDEGFDVLDNDNIYLVQKFFERVKGDFDNVVIITHIDAHKDATDHIINVSQTAGVSKLQMS